MLALVKEGLTNFEIAERLGLSERTAESPRFHAYGKLGLKSKATTGTAERNSFSTQPVITKT